METTQCNGKDRHGGGTGNPVNDISGAMATDREDSGAKAKATGRAKWTFLVYMAGDNNLDGAALRDIAEMAKAGSTKDVHILVQLDRLEDQKTRRFRITRGGGFKKDCIETFSETNTGDPQVLFSFCQWALENYPADRYALILWNHGSGWWEEEKGRLAGPAGSSVAAPVHVDAARLVGAAPCQDVPAPQSARNDADVKLSSKQRRRSLFRHAFPQALRSICYDDTSDGDALDNRELRVVLAGVCALLGRKIDLLGMDACLMNMVEVAWQLRDSVNILVGSEIEEPFDGWPYAEILSRLTARPRQDAAALARWIVKSYLLSYKGQDETVTQSAIDLGRIEDVAIKINVLSEALLDGIDTEAELIETAWNQSPRFFDDNYIDLACFSRNLRKKAGAVIKTRANDLLAVLKPGKGRAILRQGRIGQEVRGTCGLSIYFPADRINTAYRSLDFSEDCRWITFLERYLS